MLFLLINLMMITLQLFDVLNITNKFWSLHTRELFLIVKTWVSSQLLWPQIQTDPIFSSNAASYMQTHPWSLQKPPVWTLLHTQMKEALIAESKSSRLMYKESYRLCNSRSGVILYLKVVRWVLEFLFKDCVDLDSTRD